MSASFCKAGLGARGWGLKSPRAQSSVFARSINCKKLFSRCVLLASSPQSPVSGVEL